MKNTHLAILTEKNFLRIWLSQIFSTLSASSLNFVLIGKIFAETQSAVAVGFYIFFYYLPTVLLGLFVGVFIDNWNKKYIFIFSNLIQSIIVLSYLGIKEKIWPIYFIVFMYSFLDEFFNPAVGASLPSVVKKNSLTVANSLFFFTCQGSLIAGSFLGGLMLKFFPNQNYIYLVVSGLLFLGAILPTGLPANLFRGSRKLKINFKDPLDLAKTFDLESFREQLKEGYEFIKNEPRVLFPILLLAGLQILSGMAMVILPSLARILRIEFADSSFLIILPAILGAIIGALILGKIAPRARKIVFMLIGLFSLGLGTLFITLISFLHSWLVYLAIPIISFIGAGYIFIYIPLQTLIQENTPFDIRGRVFGCLSTIVNLSAVFPMLFVTTLIDFFGLRLILALLGIGILSLTFFAEKKKKDILLINQK